MTTTALPLSSPQVVQEQVAAAVRAGLTTRPRQFLPLLWYDVTCSVLFDGITGLPEYYLTRTERAIFAAHAAEILAQAATQPAGAEPCRLRILELGAGSADKTRLLLSAAVKRQGPVLYEPLDVSPSALEAAKERI